jgi:hypothetical protein
VGGAQIGKVLDGLFCAQQVLTRGLQSGWLDMGGASLQHPTVEIH